MMVMMMVMEMVVVVVVVVMVMMIIVVMMVVVMVMEMTMVLVVVVTVLTLVLGIRPALMAVWHCGLLLLPCHCPHSRWPSLTHMLFSHRQPWFYGWGFNLPRGQALLEKWNLIPEGVDVLVTHGPPLGFLDWVPKKMQRVGCVELLNTVQRRVQPRLHVFGHIHEGQRGRGPYLQGGGAPHWPSGGAVSPPLDPVTSSLARGK
ncbi:hypothetical protein J1605_020508 [Eschrichtius robustus]|uniref:Metallophosphoesterase domain-containing protein 1 n=1 Tax=Eschrichtius robustus TaxID=9764 RepID=A0AB34HG48_ESCRO|nr:hypothetical protein J1605_020508 [Eschrichtius robustus]